MQVEAFAEVLADAGIRSGAGVPCSYFTPIVNHMTLSEGTRYVGAASEGEAVAIAAGLVTGGQPAFTLMQNSGLGNAVNPITSLLHTYRIPVMLLVSHRGAPGQKDEPQHALMGAITEQLSELCGLATRRFDAEVFGRELAEWRPLGVPGAWVFPKGSLTGAGKMQPPPVQSPPAREQVNTPHSLRATMLRADALGALLPVLNGGLEPAGEHAGLAVISTTGKTSRELYELDDRDHTRRNRFYMVGSMGCAAAFGLGVALAQPERPVVVLDGDGSLLMKLGTLTTVGATAPAHFHHVLLDNGAHDSTGAQPTASSGVDFAVIARACGYRRVATVADPEQARVELLAQLAEGGPTLLRILTLPGTRGDLGRPTLAPPDGWTRFAGFLNGTETA